MGYSSWSCKESDMTERRGDFEIMLDAPGHVLELGSPVGWS